MSQFSSVSSCITLVAPNASHEQQVWEAREILRAEGVEDGLAGLTMCESYAEWLDFEKRGQHDYGDDYVPSSMWLGVLNDGTVVGFLHFRHDLNAFLSQYGGHIGYSVLPAYRRHGYAKAMLAQAKQKARDAGMKRLLITCYDTNAASERTIRANGGQLDSSVMLDNGQCIRRFWIALA